MDEQPLTKISFGFTEEDMVFLQRAKELLRVKHGEVSNVTAIRTALREYVGRIDKKDK